MVKDDYPFSKIEIGESFSSGISTHVDWKPRTNIIEMGDLITVEVELPGVNKEDVTIFLQDSKEIVIKGFKAQPRLNEQQVTYHLFEREFGSFYKKITIQFPLDVSKIDSIMENGVLTIRLPRKKVEKISVDIK
jgi:HSP20 family protein